MDKLKTLKKAFSYGFVAVVLITAIYIMANNIGLAEGLDFGAGAYYYADIPGFENIVNTNAYTSPVPMWVLIVLFLVWGYIMYRFWQYIASSGSNK